MTKDKESRKDWAPKVPKENRETVDHDVIRARFKSWTRRRGMRARALRQGMTTMSCDEMTNVMHPYWQDGKSIASFERAHNPTSETGILWWSERIGVHPGMLMINRPNCFKGWDGLLNQVLHVFEQTPDGSGDFQYVFDQLQTACEIAMEYFQQREEKRAAEAQEEKVVVVPAGMVDDLKAYVKQTEEGKKMLKEKWGIDL